MDDAVDLVAVDGRLVRGDLRMRCDVVVIGSGPGGATAARALTSAGADVVIVEEGRYWAPGQFSTDPIGTMSGLYRGCGLATTAGAPPIPLLYGQALGGTSVVNSAICWRLPRSVHDEWIKADPALGEALPWEHLDSRAAAIERELGVRPTDPAIAGRGNELMAQGADALGYAHQPINRNVAGCRGLGRCNQGCPAGAKLSMDRTFLPAAVAGGARIVTSARVRRIDATGRAATGVTAITAGGGRLIVLADRAVVVAAGTLGTPALLAASDVRHGPVGRRFQCHLGVTVTGKFADPVRSWNGATQGHEVTSFLGERIKLEVVGLAPPLLAHRLDTIGTALAADLADLSHWASWAALVRSTSMGTVNRRSSRVRFTVSEADVRRMRRAIGLLGRLFLAAGATAVGPGVAGWPARVSDARVLADLESDGPADPLAYSVATSHMFGTAVIGSDPAASVVRPDFRHHVVDRLYLADASVFPTNLGVNPQLSIMTLAQCGAEAILGQIPSGQSAWRSGGGRLASAAG
jgi:choline dehydrogenase-like flavoprotein